MARYFNRLLWVYNGIVLTLLIVTLVDLFTFEEPLVDTTDQKQYAVVHKKYPWLTKKLYTIVKRESKGIPIENPHFLVFALIQAESEGNPRALGPRVRHYSHRARGLMQVMPFWIKGAPERLYDPETNVTTGIKIFKQYYNPRYRVSRALKNYNSGPGSSYYNWEYIRKILKAYNAMQADWAIQR